MPVIVHDPRAVDLGFHTTTKLMTEEELNQLEEQLLQEQAITDNAK